MAQVNKSIKHAFIDKANATIVAVTAGACFVVVFSAVASYTLFGQMLYQNKVISGKSDALKTLQSDLSARDSLVNSYKAFVGTTQNVIGGNPTGNGPQDGDNAKIVLDALPSKYDFPALATSLEKIATSQNVAIESITGTDDEVAQAANGSSSAPQPVEMPFTLSISGNYDSLKNVINELEHSIRPINIQNLGVTANDKDITVTISATTYYQPAKSLNIISKVQQ